MMPKVIVMEKIVEQTMLYDFYGELLTDRQKEIYEDIVFNDLSLSEAAADYGISRQGVHDVVRRVDHTLAGYEEKLHLVEKFRMTKALADEILQVSGDLRKELSDADRKTLDALSEIERAAVKIKEL